MSFREKPQRETITVRWFTGLSGFMLMDTEIRIHEHTERGDNEDIKKNKGKTTLGGTKCCSA